MAQNHIHKSSPVPSSCPSPKTPQINYDIRDSSNIFFFFLHSCANTDLPSFALSTSPAVAQASPLLSAAGQRFLLTVAKPVLCPLAQGKAAVPAHVGVHSVTQNKSMFATVAHVLGKLPRYLSPLLSSSCSTRD